MSKTTSASEMIKRLVLLRFHGNEASENKLEIDGFPGNLPANPLKMIVHNVIVFSVLFQAQNWKDVAEPKRNFAACGASSFARPFTFFCGFSDSGIFANHARNVQFHGAEMELKREY